jgi:hypothetical protein
LADELDEHFRLNDSRIFFGFRGSEIFLDWPGRDAPDLRVRNSSSQGHKTRVPGNPSFLNSLNKASAGEVGALGNECDDATCLQHAQIMPIWPANRGLLDYPHRTQEMMPAENTSRQFIHFVAGQHARQAKAKNLESVRKIATTSQVKN